MRRMLHRASWTAGGAVTSSAELNDMSSCTTPGTTAEEGVRVDEHSLVRCAFSVYQGDKSGQGEARGDSNGDLDDALARPGKNLIFAAKDLPNAAELGNMCPDGRVGQVGGDAGEPDSGAGVTERPAVDQGAVAGLPEESDVEAGQGAGTAPQ
jgi:hypothetical protein